MASFIGMIPSRIAIAFILNSIVLPTAIAPAQSSAAPPKKLALLVGVSDYFHKNMEDLQYAENDVEVIGQELKRLGFQVTLLTGRNATRAKVASQIARFMEATSKLENEDIAFVMFSGHGQQLMALQEKRIIVDNEIRTVRLKAETPYFCPRDAVPFDRLKHDLSGKTEEEIARDLKLVSLNGVIGQLDARSNSRRNLLVVDACRNNPAKGKSANITGSTTRELPNGLSILFAAESGQKSWESSDRKIKHGVMSYFLIEGLRGKAKDDRNEITWGDLTNFVKKSVIRDRGKLAGGSDRIQNPHSINSDSDLIVLGKKVRPRLLVSPFTSTDIQRARKAWANYLGVSEKIVAAAGIELVLIPPGRFTFGNPWSDDELAEMTGLDKKQVTSALSSWSNELQKQIPDDSVAGRPSFTVTIEKPFYISNSEITVGQFRRFVEDTERKMSKGFPRPIFEDGTWVSTALKGGSWDDPGWRLNEKGGVTNVLPIDVLDYCTWLSGKTDRRIRLVTDREWEYVFKAGTDTLYFFGNRSRKSQPYKSIKKGFPYSPDIRLGAANPFGVYDLIEGTAVNEVCRNTVESMPGSYVQRGYYDTAHAISLPMNHLSRIPVSSSGRSLRTGFRVVQEIPE